MTTAMSGGVKTSPFFFEKECGFKIDEIMSIKIDSIPEDRKEFFNTLVDFSFGNVHIDHYETFTYMLRASKNNE